MLIYFTMKIAVSRGYQRKPGQNAHQDLLNSPEAEMLTV